MKKFALILLSAVLAIGFSMGGAQAAQSVPVKLEGISVQAYSNGLIDQYQARTGQIETVDATGKVLLAISFLVDPQWTEQVKRLEIKRDDIYLTVGGQKITMLGYLRYTGILSLTSRSFYASRPYKWPQTLKKLSYNVVFMVPAGTTQATLQFGDASAPIAVPAKAAPMPNPAGMITAEILSVRRVQSAFRMHSAGRAKYRTTVTNPGGGLLEVKLRFTATRSNQIDNPKAFFWYTPWWGVAYDNGGVSPCLGELRKDGSVHNNYSHSRYNSGGGAFKSEEITLYFLAPAASGGFKLLFLNRPVAQGAVSGSGSTMAAPAPMPAPKSSGKQPAAAAPAPAPAPATQKSEGGLKRMFKRLPGVD